MKINEMNELHKCWTKLCSKYTNDTVLINHHFEMLVKAYNEPQRYYHNLEHIASILSEIEKSTLTVTDIPVLHFAAWFHDAVYDSHKKDNEIKSAQLAEQSLIQLQVPSEIIDKVRHFILATANHMDKSFDSETDLAFFLDCDLKILGVDNKSYIRYTEQIRKEYQHIPSIIYSFERKRVLKRFIISPGIYRTTYFINQFEKEARNNILNEIQTL